MGIRDWCVGKSGEKTTEVIEPFLDDPFMDGAFSCECHFEQFGDDPGGDCCVEDGQSAVSAAVVESEEDADNDPGAHEPEDSQRTIPIVFADLYCGIIIKQMEEGEIKQCCDDQPDENNPGGSQTVKSSLLFFGGR